MAVDGVCSDASILPCPAQVRSGQVRTSVQLVPLIPCLNGSQEGANWWRSPPRLHNSPTGSESAGASRVVWVQGKL